MLIHVWAANASDPQRFLDSAMAVFSRPVTATDLQALIGNPLEEDECPPG